MTVTVTGIDLIKLRQMWPKELKRFNDAELASEYADFIKSQYINDIDRFREWIVMTDG